MVMPSRMLHVVVVPIAALILAACSGKGGNSDATSAPAGNTVREPPAAASGGRNACALVNQGEIEAIAGRKVRLLHDIEAPDQTTCELRDDASPEVTFVYVKVLWAGGKEQAAAETAGRGLARQAIGGGDADIEALTGSGNVHGLADQAFYSDVMPSWFLKGDVLVEVISPLWPHDKTLATFKSVAASALSRL